MKKLIIVLDNTIDLFTAITYDGTFKQLEKNEDLIITPQTTFIDNFFTDRYRVIVVKNGMQICLNDRLKYPSRYKNEKELKLAHNAERLILNGTLTFLEKFEGVEYE